MGAGSLWPEKWPSFLEDLANIFSQNEMKKDVMSKKEEVFHLEKDPRFYTQSLDRE
jgi:hypothetical protein